MAAAEQKRLLERLRSQADSMQDRLEEVSRDRVALRQEVNWQLACYHFYQSHAPPSPSPFPALPRTAPRRDTWLVLAQEITSNSSNDSPIYTLSTLPWQSKIVPASSRKHVMWTCIQQS